jgi:hypothetical protein
MGGLFGGLLGFIDAIGKAAWKPNSSAGMARVLFGGAIVGLGLGALSFVGYFVHQDYPPWRESNRYTIPLLLIPLVFLVLMIL